MGNKNYISCKQKIQQITKTPLMVCLIYVMLISSQVGNWITNGVLFKDFIAIDNVYIIEHYQLWRIITGWLCQKSILTLLIILFSGWSFFIKFQYKNSSIVLFNDFFVNNLIYTFYFKLIEIVLIFLFNIQSNCSFSVVGIWINLMYKCCFYNNHKQFHICITKCKISLIWLPFLLFFIICIINFNIRIDALFGLLIGIIECAKFNGGLTLFTKDTYEKKENYFNWFKITKLSNWQPLDSNKIKENNRLTVSSSQFYLNLFDGGIEEQIPNEQPMESSNLSLPQVEGTIVT